MRWKVLAIAGWTYVAYLWRVASRLERQRSAALTAADKAIGLLLSGEKPKKGDLAPVAEAVREAVRR